MLATLKGGTEMFQILYIESNLEKANLDVELYRYFIIITVGCDSWKFYVKYRWHE